METVSESTRLRDIYNTRWWNVELESYFVHFNIAKQPLKTGE